MEGKKNLCAMIPAELHARIMAEKEEMKLGTLAEYVERIFAEHFEGGNDMQSDVFSYLSRIEQNINDNGFTTRRATEQDLKKMLGVYFEQNVTTEKFEDFDGDRWVIVGE